jgi:hypothetical protein
MQLPKFVAHYHHHQEAHENPNLFDFMTDHFFAENHHDDHAGEKDLPFDHEHFLTKYQHQLAFSWFEYKYQKTTPEPYSKEIKNVFCNRPFSFDFVSNIWQPPKTV